jgi:hypothetical protein
MGSCALAMTRDSPRADHKAALRGACLIAEP